MQRGGQYQGLEYAYSAASTTASPSQVVLTIQETHSELISGTWNTEFSSGTFTGTLRADQIENVFLTKTSANSASAIGASGAPFMGYSSSNSYLTQDGTMVCLGKYTGSLQFNGVTIQGSLVPSSTLLSASNLCSKLEINASRVN